MRNNKILPGHHGHEDIDEWFAQRAVSSTAERILSAVLAIASLIGCFYTAGPVDKTAPFLFYVLRELFGENTCIGFLALAGLFAFIAVISGNNNPPYDNGKH